MTDYIERETAIKEIKREWAKLPLSETTGFGILMRVLTTLPDADVKPAVHGKWIKVPRMNDQCDQCKHYFPVVDFINRPFQINFCPYCGADMREPE